MPCTPNSGFFVNFIQWCYLRGLPEKNYLLTGGGLRPSPLTFGIFSTGKSLNNFDVKRSEKITSTIVIFNGRNLDWGNTIIGRRIKV